MRQVGVLQRDVAFVFLLVMQKALEVSQSPCSGMPFFVFNDSSEISEQSGPALAGALFPNELLASLSITARILVLGGPCTIEGHKMLCQRDLDLCYCLKISSLLIHTKATVCFLSNGALTLCGQ